jgi:hypothetical protein
MPSANASAVATQGRRKRTERGPHGSTIIPSLEAAAHYSVAELGFGEIAGVEKACEKRE